MIGHGVATSSFSSQIKNHNRGSKKPSIASPLAREKSRNAPSTASLKSRKSRRDISGNSVKKSSMIPPINTWHDPIQGHAVCFLYYFTVIFSLSRRHLQTPTWSRYLHAFLKIPEPHQDQTLGCLP